MDILLSGIVGSTAYGLAGPESDVDRLAVFAAPTRKLLGLHMASQSHVNRDPDITYHEAGKYLSLAIRANPTITELLWLPGDLYEVRTSLGDSLIAIRSFLLSAPMVRNAYLGYATQQFSRIRSRGDNSFSSDTRNRTEKHARHLLRLLVQGLSLYEKGNLTVRLEDPGRYQEFGKKVAQGHLGLAEQELRAAEYSFDNAVPALPASVDETAAEQWLQQVRTAYWEA